VEQVLCRVLSVTYEDFFANGRSPTNFNPSFFLFSILILFTSFSSLGRKEIIVGVGCGGGDGCFLVDAVQAGISV